MTKKRRSADWYGKLDKDGFTLRSRTKNQGYPDHAFDGRPIIGNCNTWSELTPCNSGQRDLAEGVKRGVWEAGGLPVEFPAMSNTILALKDAGPKGYSGMSKIGNIPPPPGWCTKRCAT